MPYATGSRLGQVCLQLRSWVVAQLVALSIVLSVSRLLGRSVCRSVCWAAVRLVRHREIPTSCSDPRAIAIAIRCFLQRSRSQSSATATRGMRSSAHNVDEVLVKLQQQQQQMK